MNEIYDIVIIVPIGVTTEDMAFISPFGIFAFPKDTSSMVLTLQHGTSDTSLSFKHVVFSYLHLFNIQDNSVLLLNLFLKHSNSS